MHKGHIVCTQCNELLHTAPAPKVSSTADTVPPTRNQLGREKPVQTIEKTGKQYKAIMLVGGLVAIVGIVFSLSGDAAGIPVTLMGLGLFLVAKIAAWWSHG